MRNLRGGLFTTVLRHLGLNGNDIGLWVRRVSAVYCMFIRMGGECTKIRVLGSQNLKKKWEGQ